MIVNRKGRARSATVVANGGREHRYGTYAVVHGGWYTRNRKTNDVAFIILNQPFGTVKPLSYAQTPTGENGEKLTVDVYGFPKDTADFAPRGQFCVSEGATMKYDPSLCLVYHEGDTEPGEYPLPYLPMLQVC